MKTWIRNIGCIAFLGHLTSAGVLLAQSGYNTSGKNQSSGNPSSKNPVSSNNTGGPSPAVQPDGQQQPNLANSASNPGIQQTGLNPALNPALQPKPDSARLVVTSDPYVKNPITPQEQQYIDKILEYWEQNTKNIERLSCDFKLFTFDSNSPFVQQIAQQTGKDIREVKAKASQGVIRYMKPDKGMYRIDLSIALTGKLDAKGQPEMLASDQILKDYWVCDGETLHEYNQMEKKATHYVIPDDLRGKNIMETPLPFLFGIEVKKVQSRYWIRLYPPPALPNGQPNNDIFFVEAYPKLQQDAVNYSKVHIFLDRKEFLPVAMIVYQTEHLDEPDKPLVDRRDYYEFFERKRDASLLAKFSEAVFRKEFIPLTLPSGWTEETKQYVPLASHVADMSDTLQQQTPFQRGPQSPANGPSGATPAQPPLAGGNQPAGNRVPGSANLPPTNGLRK